MSSPIATAGDTIAAVATPPGRGGVGIVRISGPAAGAIAEQMLGQLPAPRRAEYLPFVAADGETLDQGIALWFPGPHSFTGEDVLELQGHGGPVLLDALLACAYGHGARPANPGEFSERAFLNGKLDLAQAEAVADLIDAVSEQAARSALRSLQGEFSRHVNELVEGLTELRVYVESALDFSDEEIDFLADEGVESRLKQLQHKINLVYYSARQGTLLREGMTLVLAGQPNAGKSSLLNALAGHERAIVTDIPGTTRDVLREQIHIEGMPLHIIDTAGLREGGDAIEQEGMRRTWEEIERADKVLLLLDDRHGFTPADKAIIDRLPKRLPLTLVYNKCDLSGRPPGPIQNDRKVDAIAISAREGVGLDCLTSHLKKAMGYTGAGEGSFTARRRHLDALRRAAHHIQEGHNQLAQFQAGELLAEELRLAQDALGEITGAIHSDDLLGRIFSTFCIGK